VVEDFNEDGAPDLVAVNYTENPGGGFSATLHLNDGTGSFGAAQHLAVGSGPFQGAAADFNKDNHIDLAIGNHGDGAVSVLYNDGSANFAAAVDWPAWGGAMDMAAADLDGDTYPDIALADGTSPEVTILWNGGVGNPGNFATVSTLSVGNNPLGIALGDMDGVNGRDVIVANTATGRAPSPSPEHPRWGTRPCR